MVSCGCLRVAMVSIFRFGETAIIALMHRKIVTYSQFQISPDARVIKDAYHYIDEFINIVKHYIDGYINNARIR